MPTKEILFGEDSKKSVKAGLDKVANAVKVTLGPKGKTVIIGHKYGSRITKDGVTVAKSIQVSDETECIGANIIKEVSTKTVREAGDGTTSAMILAQSIVEEGYKLTSAGHSAIELKSGIDKGVKMVVEKLKSMSVKVESDSEKLKQIATISANNDESIGTQISEAYKKTGKDGVITIEDSKTAETHIVSIEGMQFDKGYISPYFVNDFEKETVQFEGAKIMVCAGKVTKKNQVVKIMEQVIKEAQKDGKAIPLIIIAEEIDGEALGIMLYNRQKNEYPICGIKAPGFGDDQKEMLRDICAVVGATLCDDELGTRSDIVKFDQLGTVHKIVISKDDTTLVGGSGKQDEIEQRIKSVRISLEKVENDFARDQLQKRLGKLSGGVAVLYVGGSSEIERGEIKDRCEDALKAAQAALAEGVVPGGGTALIQCIDILADFQGIDGEKEGVKLLQKALATPFKQMVENGDLQLSVNDVKKLPLNEGYNFKTDKYENLMDSGVVDPVKVVRVSLENAASVAGVLLTSEVLIVNVDDPNQMNMPQFKR